MIIKRRNNDLYYISRNSDLGGRYLEPYIPETTFYPSSWTTRGLTGKNIKRIPVYPSITQALEAEGIGKGDLTGMTFYIYRVPSLDPLEIHDTSESEIPGSSVTGEKWIIPYDPPRLVLYKTIVVTGKSRVHNISWGPSQRLSIQEYRWSESGSQVIKRTSKIYIPWTKSGISVIKPGLRRIQVFKTESEARKSGLGDYIYRPSEKVPVIDASGKLWIDTDVKVK